MAKVIKLKNLLKEHSFSLAGGVVSRPAFHNDMSLTNLVKEKYGTPESEPKISSEQILSKIQEFGNLGDTIYQSGDLKEAAKTLSDIAKAASVHTLRETEDWFDKVTVNRNMKELTNLSKQFGKLSEDASSVQQRLSALYEDMGNVLSRYYDLNETHTDGHESDDVETQEIETGEENPYREPQNEAREYAAFSKKTGRLVHYKSKEARDKALKDGRAKMSKKGMTKTQTKKVKAQTRKISKKMSKERDADFKKYLNKINKAHQKKIDALMNKFNVGVKKSVAGAEKARKASMGRASNLFKKESFDNEITEEDTKYAKFFRGALNKFGVSSPAELGDKKKAFYNYVDKNYQAKQETD